MKTIKELLEVYKPKSPDEQKFVDKHVTIKHKDRNGNGDDVFKATNVKTVKRSEDGHGYDAGDDEKVYEEVEELDEEIEALDEAVELLDEGKVGYKHYTITSGPKMSGMGEGGPDHIEGSTKKLKNLDIEHKQGDDYGTTRRVTVTNNQTGESTHHHVYQREWGHNQSKPTISVRTVGNPKAAQAAHHNVLKHYLSGKTKIKEEVELDDLAFFEDLLEMNLDEDTFTDASLANLRVMKHKQKMKEIENSSKKHPLMKVRLMSDARKKLAELEKARDHYVAKHEKAQSKKKKVAEEVELDEKTLTPSEMKKREEIVKAVKRENPGMDKSMAYAIATKTAKRVAEEVEELDELSKGTLGSYAKKAMKDAPEKDRMGKAFSDLAGDEAKRGDREGASHFGKRAAQLYTKAANRRAGVEKAIDKLAKEEYEDLDESAKVADHLIKRYGDNVRKSHIRSAANDFGVGYVALSHAVRKKLGVNRLEEEQLDELSFKKLAAYTSKSADSVSGAPVRKQDNRIKGQSLADKKIRKMDGYSSTAKVAATNGKLTKEDIINRAIEKYMPEDYTPPSLEERFLDKIVDLPEAHAVTLLALFDSLNEENKMTMIESVETEEGVNALLDFAINNRGE